MENNRKYKRENLICYLNVIDKTTFESVGFLEDITTKGLRVKSSFRIPKQKLFKFLIDLPSKINENDQIVLEATSIWSKPDKQSFINGFIINEISEKYLSILEALINSFSFGNVKANSSIQRDSKYIRRK